MKRLPISPRYDRAIYEAVALQVLFGLFGLMILDGGGIAQICGIALVAFLGRRSRVDLAASTVSKPGGY